jgi:hypothetical protein
MIDFEVFSDDPEDHKLIARYWAMDAAGNFVETVASILPYGEISKTHQLVKYINEISAARDMNQTCLRCEGDFMVRSRSDVKTKPAMARQVCLTCQSIEDHERKEAIEAENVKLQARLAKVEERNLEETCDYGSIPDDLALILLALEKAINPRLLTGSFQRSDCRGLAPVDNGNLIQRLWAAKLVVDLPSKATLGAYFLKDGQVWHFADKVTYVFVPDALNGKNEEAFSVLTTRDFCDYQAIRQLWLDYALSDCMAYLFEQSSTHGLETSSEADAEISSTLRTALDRYSVAQLWSVIWKIVRDAASLSTREYYNKTKAAATIPGKIKRNLEQVAKGNVHLNAWTRPIEQPAGTLGDVFYEYFKIDENTLGSTVQEMLSELDIGANQLKVDPPAEVIEGQTRILMRQALARDISASVMLHFADRIRNGDDALTALDAVFAAYPLLENAS